AARDQHEAWHEGRSTRRERDGDRAAQRVPDDDDGPAVEGDQKVGDDSGVVLDARARRRIGLTVSRQVERDQAHRPRQALELLHPGARAHARAVDQQRRARAAALAEIGYTATAWQLDEAPRDLASALAGRSRDSQDGDPPLLSEPSEQ